MIELMGLAGQIILVDASQVAAVSEGMKGSATLIYLCGGGTLCVRDTPSHVAASIVNARAASSPSR